LKFKIDENLPQEYAELLRRADFQADTVDDELLSGTDDAVLITRCRAESRVLLTLDLEFGNIRAYPPESFSGIIVFRSKSQDKQTLIDLLKRLIPSLTTSSPDRQLWIVENDRIRIRA
jgi:predicted nuclease of predicted toxin-antitoxin system